MKAIRMLPMAFVIAGGIWFGSASVSYATTPNVDPLVPPTGMRPSPEPPPGVQVKVETIQMTAAACAAQPGGAAAGCTITHRSWAVTHQPLPRGTRFAAAIAGTASAAGSYYYWHAYDQENNCIGPACTWSLNLEEDGVENGSNVWQWNHYCTPTGNAVMYSCSYWYNGGGYPNYAMEFGLNGASCIPTGFGQVCYNHGMRRWINDYGQKSSYYIW